MFPFRAAREFVDLDGAAKLLLSGHPQPHGVADVSNYRNQLLIETNAATRAIVLELLVAAEDRLGLTIEQFALAREYIARCDEHIARQRADIERMQKDGRDPSEAETLLSAYTKVRRLHEQFSERIRAQLARL
jgi:hypothetical protein